MMDDSDDDRDWHQDGIHDEQLDEHVDEPAAFIEPPDEDEDQIWQNANVFVHFSSLKNQQE